jgi:putative ABC transport system permease protein
MLSTFALRNLLRRPARVLVLVVAILLVATGFAFLTSQVQTTQILVRGTLNKNFRPAYDLLVTPPKTETGFERKSGLVDENYLSGLFGGISLHQLTQIKTIPGVSLAAPVAMIGYHELQASITVPLTSVEASTPDQVFAIRSRWVAENGLSLYPGTQDAIRYYYFTTDPLVPVKMPSSTASYPAQVVPGATTPKPVCAGFDEGSGDQGGTIACESPTHPDWASTHLLSNAVKSATGSSPVAVIDFTVPVLLAAIDPNAEAWLVGLRRAMITGRYLREGEGDSVEPVFTGKYRAKVVPLIASSRTYLDQWIDVTLERLATPTGTVLVSAMTQPSAYKLVTTAASAQSKTLTISPTSAYRALLAHLSTPTGGTTGTLGLGVQSYVTASEAKYRVLGKYRLAPVTINLGPTGWSTPSSSNKLVPPGGDDTAFRNVTVHIATTDQVQNGVLNNPVLKVVGTFDPTKLEKFSALSHVPLQTFFPPIANGANQRSRKLLATRPLGPTTDVASYLSEPPLLITTLTAAKPFFNRADYSTGASVGKGIRKPISAIQVRVLGLSGARDKSFARLRQIAVAIEQKTGLTVEVTAGSSPEKVTIDLAAGKFGRPALQLTQGWVKTNTAATLLRGIDKESLSLWALLLVVCSLFVGNAVVADLRGRRKELATLVTTGWTRGELTRLALFEVAAIGLFAGISGTVLAIALVEGFGLHLALSDALLVTPGGLVLSLFAGTGPVLRATRSVRPVELVREPPAEIAVRRSVRGITALALLGAWRRRGRSALGILALAVGVGAATYLVGIEAAFHGEVVGTLLGNAVDLQVRGADLLALVLIGVVAAGIVADLSYLSLKEREPQLATLRATGWGVGDVARLVMTEAFVVALVGGAIGAGIGYWVLSALHAPAHAAVPTAVGSLVAGVVLALVSSIVPVIWWRRAPLSQRLVEL